MSLELSMAQGGLIDHVVSGAHGCEGGLMFGLERVEVTWQLPDISARRSQRREIAPLVRYPHRGEQLCLGRGRVPTERARSFEMVAIHPRAERTVEELVDVAGGEDQTIRTPEHRELLSGHDAQCWRYSALHASITGTLGRG
jgi:hypothetical protein